MTFKHLEDTNKKLASSMEMQYAGVLEEKSQSPGLSGLSLGRKLTAVSDSSVTRQLPDDVMVIDGATGSELDRRGVDCVLPYWSAGAMIHSPDVLKEVHKHYLRCGATAITTNTFNTHRRKLDRAGVGHKAEELVKMAVRLACEARDEVNPDALVFGCISSIGMCYDAGEKIDYDILRKEHRDNMQYMVDEGADFLILETMCTRDDLLAAVENAEELMPGKWGVCFSLPEETVGIMRDGTPVKDLIPKLTGAAFIGVNCMDGKTVAVQVKHLREIVPKKIRIAAYGNIGFWVPPKNYKAGVKKDNSIKNDALYAACVKEWLDAGASIVGGCCGTSPDTIRMLNAVVEIWGK